MGKILLVLGIAGLLFTGCASAPSKRVTGYSASAGDKAADTALTMIGRPYKYRGDMPAGFDCSGLVRYSYLTAGIDVPHGTKALRNSTRSVGLRNARKGDLLFFIQEGKKYSHVGIYVGNDQFVHAPSTGGFVRQDSTPTPIGRSTTSTPAGSFKSKNRQRIRILPQWTQRMALRGRPGQRRFFFLWP
jgi:cell wall-associated NlpC family hydrolase